MRQLKLIIGISLVISTLQIHAFVNCNLEGQEELNSSSSSISVMGISGDFKFSYETKTADWRVYYSKIDNVELRVFRQFSGREGYQGVNVINHDLGSKSSNNCMNRRD